MTKMSLWGISYDLTVGCIFIVSERLGNNLRASREASSDTTYIMIADYRSHSIRLLLSVVYDARAQPVSLSLAQGTAHRTDGVVCTVSVSSPTHVRIASSSEDSYHTFHSPCSSPSGAPHSTACQ